MPDETLSSTLANIGSQTYSTEQLSSSSLLGRSVEKIGRTQSRRGGSCTYPGNTKVLCLHMHVVLVIMHLVLLGVWARGIEQRVVVAIGRQTSILSIGLSMASQAFATLYLAALVFVTQQLSLRRNLSLRQTITAAHDKSTAWTGLGSALNAVWNQIAVASSFWGVFSIALYLICVSALKISTPTLFSVVPFNATVQAPVTTSLGNPFLNYKLFMDETTDQDKILMGERQRLSYTYAATTLSLITHLRGFQTVGLYQNSLYDVLDNSLGQGHVHVNASTFHVTCGAIQVSNVSSFSTDLQFDKSWAFEIEISPNFRTFLGGVNTMVPNVLRLSDPMIGAYVPLLASFNITDSGGGLGSPYSIDPPMQPLYAGPDSRNTTFVYAVQLTGCSLSVTNQTTLVDVQTKTPVGDPRRKTSATWSPWDVELSMAPTGIPLYDSWPYILATPATDSSNLSSPQGCNDCSYLTLIETFVMDRLGLWAALNESETPPDPDVKLHELENVLEDVTAALFWCLAHTFPANWKLPKGQVLVSQPKLASRLSLNIVPLSVGLAASIILLALTVLLLGVKKEARAPIGNVGILQILWLSGAHERISAINNPTDTSLRKAGMFKFQMLPEADSSDALIRRSNWVRGDA